jgi:hypothetical protein
VNTWNLGCPISCSGTDVLPGAPSEVLPGEHIVPRTKHSVSPTWMDDEVLGHMGLMRTRTITAGAVGLEGHGSQKWWPFSRSSAQALETANGATG